MRMNFAELRSGFLGRVNDPEGVHFNPAKTALLLNEAYQRTVLEVDKLPGPWNVGGQRDLAIVAGTREYKVENARRIQRVKQLDDSARLSDLDEVPYEYRDDGSCAGYYVYRSGLDGEWYVGSATADPPWSQLRVYYLPRLTPLANDADRPHAVPDEAHEMIYLYAAIAGTVEQRRDPAGLAAVLADWVRALHQVLGEMTTRGVSRPLGGRVR